MDGKTRGVGLMVLGVILVLAGVGSLVLGGGEDSTPAVAAAPTTNGTSTSAPSTTSTSTTTTSTSTTSTSTTTTSTTPTTTVAVANAETPEEFLAVLLAAFSTGDADTLFSRLNQATLDRYGAEQCQAYAQSVAGIAQDITLSSTIELDSWDYVTDDQTTTLTGVTRASVERVVNTQTVPQELYWQRVDGVYTWFTDCGDVA